MSSPSSTTRPVLGLRKPQIAFITVDLPAPLSPIRPVIEPASTVRLSDRKTSISPTYPAVTSSSMRTLLMRHALPDKLRSPACYSARRALAHLRSPVPHSSISPGDRVQPPPAYRGSPE